MEHEVVNKIVKNKIPCVFVSPHLDDAALSAGNLIHYLAKKTKVSVITVFTEASKKPYTRFAGRFSRACGYKDADGLFSARKQEDLEVFGRLDVECHHLGFIDAAWRKKENPGYLTRLISKFIPEFLHLYPTFRINISSNRVPKEDRKTINVISEKLLKIINPAGNYYIFCPLAVNTHIDHVITREAVRKNFKSIIFWTDFPYSQFKNVYPDPDNNLEEILRWGDDGVAKRDMVAAYKSQIGVIFPSGNIKLRPEIYYARKDYGQHYMQEKNKPTVLVGILAYNEEANIAHLLRAVLLQREENFTLKKIIVVSGGSTDQTNEKVRGINDKRIKLIANKERKGQIYAQNRIFAEADTDVVVLFEADTLPCDDLHVSKLIEPLLIDPGIGLVQGDVLIARPKGFLAKTMKTQIEIYKENVFNREFAHWFSTGRSGRVFTKRVYKSLIWPESVPEDMYAVLWCKSRNIKTFFQESAKCYYRIPESFSDLLKANQKKISARKVIAKYYPSNLINDFYDLPFNYQKRFAIKMGMLLRFIMTNPIFLAYYIYLKVKLRLFISFENINFSDFWIPSATTKEVRSRILKTELYEEK